MKKFKTNDRYAIATELYVLGSGEKSGRVDYLEWVSFIDNHQDEFIWKENTINGKEILKNIDKVPNSFKKRVLSSLNKGACYKEFDSKKGYFNINVSFNKVDCLVGISFERKPKPED